MRRAVLAGRAAVRAFRSGNTVAPSPSGMVARARERARSLPASPAMPPPPGGFGGAVAELMARSPHLRQIEEDVREHGAKLHALGQRLAVLRTADMAELKAFRAALEAELEPLEDEGRVLSLLEGWPIQKLEALRLAAATSDRLETCVRDLAEWKAPERLDCAAASKLFDSVRALVEAMERARTTDEERFQQAGFTFDYGALGRVKEAAVQFSANVLEAAITASREQRQALNAADGAAVPLEGAPLARGRRLLRDVRSAFDLSYRVYTFAGGTNERAEALALEAVAEVDAWPQEAWS